MKQNILTIKSVIKLFLDILHGIIVSDVTFVSTIEFAIYLGYDGQLKQSDMEMELFTSVIDQLKKTKMTKIENALAHGDLSCHTFICLPKFRHGSCYMNQGRQGQSPCRLALCEVLEQLRSACHR